ncbi:MAG: biotin--[acetyl-CoA-carboxylase] ligase [Pirellulaceae bacterium]
MSLVVNGSVDRSAVIAIEQLVSDGTLASASYSAEVTSTNSAALDDVRQGTLSDEQLPRLYLADKQTGGRGRHGRTWLSSDDSLTFSLLTRRTVDRSETATLWPIAVGVAIARAIEFCFAPVKAQLKWPNDIYLDGGKVAGILLETTHGTPETVVIGIGINVNTAPHASGSTGMPSGSDGINAKSIASVVGRPNNRYELLSPLVQQVIEATQVVVDSPSEFISEFRRRCWLSGKQVTYQENGLPKSAICRGINDDGELLLETVAGTKTCHTGEVNLVRTK